MYNRKEIIKNRDPKSIGTIKENDFRFRSNNSPQLRQIVKNKQKCYCEQINKQKKQSNCFPQNINKQQPSVKMMKILLDQNCNLKQQNTLLQSQLSKMIQKEKALINTITQYESILFGMKNVNINKEIIQFSDKAKLRGQRIKTSINQIIEQRKTNGYRITAPLQQYQNICPETHQSSLTKQTYKSFTRNNSQKPVNFNLNIPNSIDYNQYKKVPFQNLEFQKLLQQCQNQTDPKIKKYLRKRLVDLTYKKSAIVGYLEQFIS